MTQVVGPPPSARAAFLCLTRIGVWMYCETAAERLWRSRESGTPDNINDARLATLGIAAADGLLAIAWPTEEP